MDFQAVKCPVCNREFPNSLQKCQHIKIFHPERMPYECEKCDGKLFKSYRALSLHQRTTHLNVSPQSSQQSTLSQGQSQLSCRVISTEPQVHRNISPCGFCGLHFSNTQQACSHAKSHCNRINNHDSNMRDYKCGQCHQIFQQRNIFIRHLFQKHGVLQQGGNDTDRSRFYSDSQGNEIAGLRDIYERFSNEIFQKDIEGPVHSEFNFPVPSFDFGYEKFRDFLDHIITRMKGQAFKMNFAFGVILRNTLTGEFSYFHPLEIDPVLPEPFIISKREDVEAFLLKIENLNVIDEATANRPDSRYSFFKISNVQFFIDQIEYLMGGVNNITLPAYLLKKSSVKSFNRETKDNLCLFRCLAFHQGARTKTDLEQLAKSNMKKWVTYKQISPLRAKISTFKGVSLSQIPEFEDFFDVPICIYTLNENDVSEAVYISHSKKKRKLNGKPMYLNLYKKHLSYISQFDAYAKKYQCKKCQLHFTRAFNCRRHEKKCHKSTKVFYPGGYYSPKETLFERMAKYGFQTPENDRFYEFLITFDLESILVPIEQGQKGPLTLTHSTHRPVSVAIANNSITTQCTHRATTHGDLCHALEETVCFVNENPKELVQQFVTHLEYIQGHTSRAMCSKFQGHFRQLHYGIEKLQEIILTGFRCF